MSSSEDYMVLCCWIWWEGDISCGGLENKMELVMRESQ